MKLIEKYDVAGPRYTSYPPIPYWKGCPDSKQWLKDVDDSLDSKREVELYLHIPFCRQICHYCGCNRELASADNLSYLQRLVREFDLYRQSLGKLKITGIHLGGGTPTILSPSEIGFLLDEIARGMNWNLVEGSLEADPRITSCEQLKIFNDYGLRRVSFGVQDFSPEVQQYIGRQQSFEIVRNLTESARSVGFREINFDLIFGLPGQTDISIERTFKDVGKLMPDTIAFYSFAYVPHFASNQKNMPTAKIPQGEAKRRLYERGRMYLAELGYVELGMDHFALSHSVLAQAQQAGKLARNFMGYTVNKAPVLIGLGASAISKSRNIYIQNVKSANEYQTFQGFPMLRGHVLSAQDHIVANVISDLMCRGETIIPHGYQEDLKELLDDGLVELNDRKLTVTQVGRTFLRNICMVFDGHLRDNFAKERFSRTI